MNFLPIRSLGSKGLILFAILFISLIIYFPQFMKEFGIIDDYSLLTIDKEKPENYYLFQAAYFRGRPIGGWLLMQHALALNNISDFAIWRAANLIGILFFLYLTSRFLKKSCALSNFWIIFFSLSALVLPCIQISILKATLFSTSALTLIIATISYFLWNSFREASQQPTQHQPWILLIASFSLFLLSLLIYPLNALIVWFFTFALVIYRPLSSWPSTRKIMFSDLTYFSCGLIAFRLIDRLIFVPFAQKQPWFDPQILPTDTYSMEIANNIFSKINLIHDTFKISLSGAWQLQFYGMAATIALMTLIIIIIGMLFTTQKRETIIESKSLESRFSIERLLTALIMMLIVNLPALLAKGCLQSPGYRAVIPLSLMGLLGLIKAGHLLIPENTQQPRHLFGKAIVIFYLTVTLLIGQQHVYASVDNYHHELKLMRKAVQDFKPNKFSRVIIIRNDRFKSFTGRVFYREFGAMIRKRPDALPFFTLKFLPEEIRGISFIVLSPQESKTINISPKDYLIDLNKHAYNQYVRPSKKIN